MVHQIILVSLIGALLCMDRIVIQMMVSRPIVIAPLLGLVFGNLYAGLIIGAILELFWIDRVPIGIYIPPNDSIAAVLAVSFAIFAGRAADGIKPEVLALSVLMAIPFGVIAKIIDVKIVESNNILSDQALEEALKLDVRAIERKTYIGFFRVLAFYIFFLLIVQMMFAPVVVWIVPKLPSQINAMLTMTYYFMPLLGIAVAINTIKLRGAVPFFCAIFLAVAVALEFLNVF